MTNEKSKILYHYTTMSVLCSLLNNLEYASGSSSLDSIYMKFWLTEDGYMNDPSESCFFLNSLQNALVNFQNINDLEDKSYIFNLTYSVWDQMDGDKYILSLSENKDNLSMWRGYGENGKGVAIGLNVEKLKSFFKKEENCLNKDIDKDFDKSKFKFLKIKYTSVIDHIYSFSNDYLEKIYNSIQIEEGGKATGDINILTELINYEKLSYKNEAYWEEKEWRLVFISNKACEFRERNGLIIPYYLIKIPLNAIKNIIIGPCTDQRLSKSSLSSMLYHKTKGLANEKNIEIISSDIPYVQK